MGTKPVMSSVSLGSKPPLRPAPPPPTAQAQNAAASSFKTPQNPEKKSSHFKMPQSLSLGRFKSQSKESVKKKPAPPRPPPPKLSVRSYSLDVNPTMPRSHSAAGALISTPDSLIDWSSPPSSPVEFASSLDGISLRSFESDNSASLAGWNQEHVRSESGFESQSDLAAWTNPPTKPTSSSQVLTNSAVNSQSTFYTPSSSSTIMPTIIKPKVIPRSKKSPPIIPDLLNSLPAIPPSSLSPPLGDESEDESDSPPEPTVPPPPPPQEVSDVPCAMALYDYNSGQPGDLVFQEGDMVYLTGKVNDEWLKGNCGDEEGIFPANFVNVLIPFKEAFPYRAEACYEFRPESAEDLPLTIGETVWVERDLGGGWLSGRSNGRNGQFPSSFVKKIS